ncbi:uncharacterized protein LTR77_001613 [Saxophila tyrrhenica]|uniref:Heterokaryon incompatibility domain-containing protein n=1 Tax=Saxophila tyrrhenica TaxID=1690608 RepID=A0AAV9PNE2_9PEZI|nr:hypothetical protein LTR77_001613 [Saxophila tyrrhenica]
MDHLPHPIRATFPPLTIPYYDKYKFDKGDFSGYPSRCGFDKTEFQWGDFCSVPWEDHDAFFQAWLFFGLLYDFFGADGEEFIDQGAKRITTASLPRLAAKWQKSLPRFSRKDRLSEYERVQKSLREACDAVGFLDTAERRAKGQSNLSEEIAYSIVVLGLTLEEVKIYHSGISAIGGVDNTDLISTQVGGWPSTELVRKRFEAGGWCRSGTKRLQSYFMATGQFYCASLESAGLQIDHSACTEDRCMAENINESTYVTAHSDACHDQTSCQHSGPQLSDMEAILEAGNYPVLSIALLKDGSSFEIKAVPYHKSIRYTAISHVWADGVGNPHANTLPICQIERLHHLLASLQEQVDPHWSSVKNFLKRSSKKEPLYFWMDTLAIPLRKDLRKKAIKLMYQVYKNATNVLVLDRTMLHFSTIDRSLEELCFRVSVSAWMRRAWTLQEGALANSLYVQFKDKAVNVVEAEESMSKKLMRAESSNVVLEESCSAIRNIMGSGAERDDGQLVTALSGIRARSTSHEEDKEICFAVMMRFDMEAVMSAEGQMRTANIYRQLPYIPEKLFWHTCPSMDISGLKWAPRSLWDCVGGIPEFGMKLSEQGLHIATSGMVFRARTHYLDRWGPHLRDPTTGKWYNFRWQEAEAFDGTRVKSKNEWTVLAVILRTAVMLNPIQDGVVIRLDQTVASPALLELQRIVGASDGNAISGEIMGRGKFEELDPATTTYLAERTEANKKGFDEFRADVRAGKSRLEDCDELTRRVVVEEGDDSWYVFDGIMVGDRQKWIVQ